MLTSIEHLPSPGASHPVLFNTNAAKEPIALTEPAYELAAFLEENGAREAPVDLAPNADRGPLIELSRKRVVKVVGGARGRRGKVSLLVSPDRLVLSKRKRPNTRGSLESTSQPLQLPRPTIEDLRLLIAAVEDAERDLRASLSTEVQERVHELKQQLANSKLASTTERDVFASLQIEMQRLQSIESEIRVQALKAVENSRAPYAGFISLLSRERSIS